MSLVRHSIDAMPMEPFDCSPSKVPKDPNELFAEAQYMEAQWREAMAMAQEQQSAFQEWTQRAETAKKQWEEKKLQQRVAVQLHQQRTKQWENAMSKANTDLERLQREHREVSANLTRISRGMNAAEECMLRLRECNPNNQPCPALAGQEPPNMCPMPMPTMNGMMQQPPMPPRNFV